MWPHLTLDQQLVFWSIIAIAASPLIALEVQKRLEEHRARYNRKLDVLRKLMTTRATQLSPVHVEALNSIEVEFYPRKRFYGLLEPKGTDKKVLDAWRLYITHLNRNMGQGDAIARWTETKNGLLIELLYQMAQSLDYDIDKVVIQSYIYHPQGFVEIETEQHALRKAALKVFSGEAPLAVTIVGPVEVIPPLPPPEGLALPPKK